MNNKLLKFNKTGEMISYYEISNLDTQLKLKKLNESDKENVIYCTCNGSDPKKNVKMMTRSLNEGNSYILANYPNSNKHHRDCPRHTFELEIASKGRTYKIKDNYFPINTITSGPNKQKALETNSIYNSLYVLGEYLLAKAHVDYCNTYNKNPISTVALGELYEYYHKYCKDTLISPLNQLIVNNSDGDIYLNDIMFNPKWISCDEEPDKTDVAIKHFRIINKKFDKPKSITKAYILLKYEGFEDISDEQVKVKMYVKGKNNKSNYDKYVYGYMDKATFLNTLNKYDLDTLKENTDKYISGLFYVKSNQLIIDEFALIHTYPKYVIPVNSPEDLELIDGFIKLRNRLLITPISKLDTSYNKEFSNNIPDYIVKNMETNKIFLIEVFNKYSPLYYQMMCDKTKYYEELCDSTEYEFIGYYKNLGWKAPPINTLLFKQFKTLSHIYAKVKSALQKTTIN